MLTLSKKTDYALIALAHLAAQPARVASARQIAQHYDLPPALLMNILKSLNQAGIIHSTRGTKGGYRLAADPHAMSLHELVLAVDGDVRLTDCTSAESCPEPACRLNEDCPVQAPLVALHHRLVRFLQDVKLADLILPGRRIDVPLERVGNRR